MSGFIGGGSSGGGGVPSSRRVVAGSGLLGGGTLSHDVTLDVAGGPDGSIIVNPDSIEVGQLASDAQHGARGGGTLHTSATEAVAGFMSPADKTAIDTELTRYHVVTVAPSGAMFTSVAAAIASITTASSGNPYVVYVWPGLYVEPPFSMKSFVSITGRGGHNFAVVLQEPS